MFSLLRKQNCSDTVISLTVCSIQWLPQPWRHGTQSSSSGQRSPRRNSRPVPVLHEETQHQTKAVRHRSTLSLPFYFKMLKYCFLKIDTWTFYMIFFLHVKIWQFTCILIYWIESNFNDILTNLWVLHCTNTQLYLTVTCITTEILFLVFLSNCIAHHM